MEITVEVSMVMLLTEVRNPSKQQSDHDCVMKPSIPSARMKTSTYGQMPLTYQYVSTKVW